MWKVMLKYQHVFPITSTISALIDSDQSWTMFYKETDWENMWPFIYLNTQNDFFFVVT